jgi:hypothetical protein
LTGHHRATVTLAALVIANLIPVFGVLQLDWDVGAIVVLYWCENLVIGCYTIVKLFMAAGAGALLSMLFFMVHYGGFCGIHGVFVLSLTGFAGDEPGSMDIMPEGTWPGPLVFPQILFEVTRRVVAVAPGALLYAVAALFISHGISFALNYIGNREYVGLKTGRIMTAPYGRILVLHIAIIAGGFLVITLGSPVGLLLALVALKIGMDIMLHRRSHRRTAKPAAAAATDSAAPPRQDTGTGEN